MDVLEYFKKDRFAAHCGMELIEAAGGHARARMTLQPHHWNGMGTIHGGALFTFADFTFAAACNSHGIVSVAIDANITFMKAVSGGVLYANAKELARNTKLGSYAVEIVNEAGDLIAQFQGLAYFKKQQWTGTPRAS
ncbi:MAG: PaaI family thioesterase [Verrucomicrobiota bacterium]